MLSIFRKAADDQPSDIKLTFKEDKDISCDARSFLGKGKQKSLKVFLTGTKGVGKSTLINRFVLFSLI